MWKNNICSIDGDRYLVAMPTVQMLFDIIESEPNKKWISDFSQNPFFAYTNDGTSDRGYYYGTDHCVKSLMERFFLICYKFDVNGDPFVDYTKEVGLVENRLHGFRPVLVPLGRNDQIDLQALGSDVKNGEIRIGGSCYVIKYGNETVIRRNQIGLFLDNSEFKTWWIGDTQDGCNLEWICWKGLLFAKEPLCFVYPQQLWNSGFGYPVPQNL